MATKSGKYWKTWADTNAKNSVLTSSLESTFKTNADAFIKALTDAGATVKIRSTRRSKKRAYLFHWSWKIGLGKAKAADATALAGVDIDWVHSTEPESQAAAKEMITAFGLAVPPNSTVAPSLTSNHINGKAIDMDITWRGKIKIKKKDGTEVEVAYQANPNLNTKLHEVGESYGLKKHKSDKPHWSVNGR